MTTQVDELMKLADDYACFAYAARSAAEAKGSNARAALRSAIVEALDKARSEMAAECAKLGWRTPGPANQPAPALQQMEGER